MPKKMLAKIEEDKNAASVALECAGARFVASVLDFRRLQCRREVLAKRE